MANRKDSEETPSVVGVSKGVSISVSHGVTTSDGDVSRGQVISSTITEKGERSSLGQEKGNSPRPSSNWSSSYTKGEGKSK